MNAAVSTNGPELQRRDSSGVDQGESRPDTIATQAAAFAFGSGSPLPVSIRLFKLSLR